MQMKNWILAVSAMTAITACGNEPTPVVTESSNEVAKDIFSSSSESALSESSGALGEGHVEVLEVLHADRYDYLRVAESNGKEYWLAARSGEFTVGTEYHYHDGLYKTDYYSTEFNRTFDEIYLVAAIHPVSAGEGNARELPANHPPVQVQESVQQPEGSISIAEVVRQAESLQGTEVQVTGKVVKVNPHIMNRNWVHLQDGSKDDYDFVVTTTTDIPTGHVVTLKGVLSVNRDFGAGYTYAIILENATIVR